MSARAFMALELVLGSGAALFCLAQTQVPTLYWLPLLIGLGALALDALRSPFPYYGFVSVGPVFLLVATLGGQVGPGIATTLFLLLALLRAKGSADLLPPLLTLSILAGEPDNLLLAALIYLILSLCHPLLRSRFFPRLPGVFAYRTWPFHLACACLLGLSAPGAGASFVTLQFFALLGLIGLVRSQRGLNLETAQQQEARALEAERLKESLLLIDALGYSLHEQARPEQVLSKVCEVMCKVSKADSSCLIERDGPRWRVLQAEGLTQTTATECFQRLEKKLSPEAGPQTLAEPWSGEQHAVLVPWEGEAVVYLGRREKKLESLPLLERLARLGAAALRTAHEKEQRQALGERGKELETLVQALTSLLEEVHFVGSTLERGDLLDRLQTTLTRTLGPDVGIVFDQREVERSWGDCSSPLPEESLDGVPLGQVLKSSLVPGHRVSVALSLGESRLYLSFAQSREISQASLHFLMVLGDMVGTFLSNSRLYSKLRETHLELEQSQTDLVQAKKLAAIGQLAAGVAHELNSPFQAIRLHLDLIRSGLQDEDDLECADTIGEALERCRVIVQQLLHFSRRPDSVPESLALEVLLTQAAIAAGLKDISLPACQELRVRGHKHELVSLFTNLLSNAKQAVEGKYPGEEPHERIAILTQDLGGQVLVEFRDQGGGIPEAIRDRIFDPFFTTKEVGSGTGLGLYMVYTYVTNAGGDIRLESVEGEGSSFFVTLTK